MACLQIAKSVGFSPALGLRSRFPQRRVSGLGCFHFRCRLTDDDKGSSGEEPPESLFMKELKRRGMTPTPLLEERNRGVFGFGESEAEMKEESGAGWMGGGSKRNGVASADYEKSLANQRERSMALNSEGLEGLVPRAKLLLTLGGTFFLGFWPLILITIAFFSALYFYFGPSFVHGASKSAASPAPYIDPYTLLEDERISQIAPPVK